MKLVLQIALGIVLAPVVAIVLILMLGSGLAAIGSMDGATVLVAIVLVGGAVIAGRFYDKRARGRGPAAPARTTPRPRTDGS